MIRFITLGALALTLGACGSKTIGQGAGVSDALKAVIVARATKGAKPVPKAVAGPKIRISLGNLGIKEEAALIADQGGYKTYQSAARRSYTFKDGQLTATRGLRNDLMSRDATGENQAYRFLTATNAVGALKMTCAQSDAKADSVTVDDKDYSAQLREQVCRNPAAAFKTRVWTNAKGAPLKAQQWVGPQSGFAVVYWIN